jgi:hypothetical protein
MTKKTQDLKMDSNTEKINLKKEPSKSEGTSIKKENIIFKRKTPFQKIKDLTGNKEEENHIYIRGKKYTPPKYLGNILRVAIAGFIIIFAVNAINVYLRGKSIESEIGAKAYEGYNFLVDAGKDATKIQFDNALKSFDSALNNFSEAEEELWFINDDYSYYGEDSSIGKAVNALLEGGKHFAEAGKYFLEAIEEFNNIPIYFVSKNTPENIQTPSITDSLKKGLEKTNLAIEQISEAASKMTGINEEVLPTEVRARFTFAKNKIDEIAATLEATSKHFPAILKLLGDRYPHRYLILLQNNNEIRPTGGFIGSYAIMDINDGYITKLETYDSYGLDGSYGGIIEPPEELKAITSNWRFRDSNYSPDFMVSAMKARWFLEKEGGPTVDTVISINQGLLKDMLEITGPVQVGDFGELTSENYNLLLSYVIEGKVWGAEDPKHILKVFIPAFKDAILKEENISKITSKIYKAIQQKHIMMYSSDEEIQELFDSIDTSGRVYRNEKDEDYLSVINIATGGTKSEQFMEESINHSSYIEADGSIINEVTIERAHLWTDDIYYQWKETLGEYGFTDMPDYVIDILGRGENKVSMRVYVPDGSKLIESNCEDIMTKYDQDLKKTYFFTKVDTSAGETSKVYVKYKLPFKLDIDPVDTYKLIVEKQPGSRGSIFTKTISANEDFENIAFYPDYPDAHIAQDETVVYPTNLVYDIYFSSVWSK